MGKKTVQIVIGPDGTVEMEAHGFKGNGCEKVVKQLVKDLGEVDDEGRKPDWSMPEPSKSTVTEKS